MNKKNSFLRASARASALTKYRVEYTDTFGGEANYSWVRRATIEATSPRSAITKAKAEFGITLPHRIIYRDSDEIRLDFRGSCTCMFLIPIFDKCGSGEQT